MNNSSNYCKTHTNSFFNSISPDSQKKILKVCHPIHYDFKKEQVFFLGDGQILILETGFLMSIRSSFDGRKAGVDILKPGDLLGIGQIFNGDYEIIISILPLSPVNGYLISIDNMTKLIKENHDICLALISQFAHRLIRVIDHFAVNTLGNSKDKLNYALQTINNIKINQPTHEELAIFSGLNRVTVSKIINEVISGYDVEHMLEGSTSKIIDIE